MADRAAQRKMVEANLRSVTQSCKGGVPIERLERDYRDLLGTPIPYKELGFSSLETMVRGMPDVIRVTRNEMGQLAVMGVADNSTAHIASLVSRQRTTKTRKISSAKPKFRSSRGGYSRQPFSNYSRNRFQIQSSFRPVLQNRTQMFYESQSSKFNKSESSPFNSIRTEVVRPNRKEPEVVRTNRMEPKVVRPNRTQPEVRQNRSDPEFVLPNRLDRFNNKPLYSASDKPEPKSQREFQKPVVPAPRRQSPPLIPKLNFEIPPRFLRKQLSLDTVPRKKRTDAKSPLPVTSPVENRVTPKFFPVDTAPIPPPTQSDHMKVLSEGLREPVPKIPSPKPKQTKDRRKTELPIPPLPNEGPPIEFVQEYARAKGLKCKFVTLQGGQKQKFYISVLHLDNKKYRSYPGATTCATTKEAEEVAASLAMKAILEEEQKPKFAVAIIETAEQIHTFVNRVEEIVSEKPNGIWDMKLPKEYENKFSESLPTVWLSLLQQNVSSNLDIEFYDAPKAHVLRYARNSGAATPSSTSSKTSSYFNEDVVSSINEESIENYLDKTSGLPSVLPPLALPDDDFWDVLVTFVSSTKNIAVRLIDQDEYFNAMSGEMKEFYKSQYLSVDNPVIGRLYAAHQIIDGQHSYYRVRVDDIDTHQKEAICYFVDIGESQSLSYIELYDLDKEFENLPFQAIHMSLDGLEDYHELMKFSDLVDKLLDKSLIAQIKKRSENQIVAVFYDTSGQEDLNLNDNLWEWTIAESLSTSLPEMGSTSICFLTHATVKGEVYLRCNDPCSCLLEDEIERNFVKFENAPPISRNELSSDNIYVTKYDDGNWYRAVFWPSSEVNEEEVELFYVDYGNLYSAPWSHVKDLGSVSKFLASLPFQANPCTLMGVSPPNVCWTENGLIKLYEVVPESQELIVKVANPGTETSPPVVMLFIRNEKSVIISINEILLGFKDLFSPLTVNGAVAAFVGTKPNSLPIHSENENHTYYAENIPMQSNANNCVASPSVLWAPTPDAGNDPIDLVDDSPPPPEIPEIDHLFDVHITYVASPSNFVIQSLKSANALGSLLDDMQAFYKNEENLCDMHLCLLKPESYYAALHKDGFWYRVKVKNIDESEQVMVAVHFIDYGDFDTVSLSNLQPLYQQFKVLPCQAIKASLHGVKPIYNDWSAEQCIEVKELINERQFVSIIKNKKRNAVDEFGEWTLLIQLIDVTSPDQDVHIHKLLVEKGLAAPAL